MASRDEWTVGQPSSRGYAEVTIGIGGRTEVVKGEGDGSIDAATQVMRKIFPHHKFDVKAYRAREVTEGSAAQGKEFIRLASNGYSTIGFGEATSTVIGAVHALTQATNRMEYVLRHVA